MLRYSRRAVGFSVGVLPIGPHATEASWRNFDWRYRSCFVLDWMVSDFLWQDSALLGAQIEREATMESPHDAPCLTSFRGPALHGPVVRMSFQMILSTRATVKMQNLLPVPHLTHLSAISAAEASGVSDASASCYGLPENVLVFAVVKPEGKLVQVQGQILPADMMKRADHSAFQQAPKAVNVAGVNYAPDVFARGMAHGPMCVTKPPKLPVALVLVGSYQRHLFADGFTDEVAQGLLVSVLNDSADHVPLA